MTDTLGKASPRKISRILAFFFQLAIVCNVMCSVCFSLDFNSVFLESYMRSYMPLDGNRGLWLSGYFPYSQLPKGLKTLVVCAQKVEYPDCNVDA